MPPIRIPGKNAFALRANSATPASARRTLQHRARTSRNRRIRCHVFAGTSCNGISTRAWVARSRGTAPLRTHTRRFLRLVRCSSPRCTPSPAVWTARHRFYFSLFLGIFAPDLRAWFNAIATACLCGLPCFVSVLTLCDTVSFDFPLLSGMMFSCRSK